LKRRIDFDDVPFEEGRPSGSEVLSKNKSFDRTCILFPELAQQQVMSKVKKGVNYALFIEISQKPFEKIRSLLI
jgi:hypothetical protein